MTDSFLSFDLHRQGRDWQVATEDTVAPIQSQAASMEDVNRFRQAMAAPNLDAAPVLPSGPFALFGASAAVQSAPSASDTTAALLGQMVSKLMVSDGYQSQRRVRMELSDDVMPGVSLALFEEGGAMVAEFECRIESSFLQLAQPAQSLASQLAVTLVRDTVWRVLPDVSATMAHLQAVEAFGKPDYLRNTTE